MSTTTAKRPSMSWFALTGNTTLSTSYANVNTYSGRKISDYDVLVIECYRGSWIIGTATVATSHFTAANGVALIFTWGSESIEYDVKYLDDTTVQAKKITSSSATVTFRIIGLALAA